MYNESQIAAKAEFDKWIADGERLDYWVLYQTLTPNGMEGLERHGMGVLKQRINNLVEMEQPTGEVLVVTTSGNEIIDYCEPQVGGGGYCVQVQSPTSDVCIALKPSEYVW
jgi:hypothetical protein